jgi:PAS domain S-box-containing protein
MATQIERVAMKARRDNEPLRQLRLVIATIPTMAWSLLPEGVVDFVNRPWLEYTGLSQQEALAGSNRIVHQEDLPGVMEKWLEDMAIGRPTEDEMRLRRADGIFRWFLVRTAPLRDEKGKIVKWYGAVVDIEEKKRALQVVHALGLSPREGEVLRLVVEGRTSKEIAAIVGIKPSSVDTYRSRIMAKLGINDMPGLVRFAIRQGVIKL